MSIAEGSMFSILIGGLFFSGLINSTNNLHVKNPIALAINARIVKVSVLNQGVRWEKGSGNHSGRMNCMIVP
jgi:hypothetical protein